MLGGIDRGAEVVGDAPRRGEASRAGGQEPGKCRGRDEQTYSGRPGPQALSGGDNSDRQGPGGALRARTGQVYTAGQSQGVDHHLAACAFGDGDRARGQWLSGLRHAG